MMMPENSERNAAGRFLPGCRPGPGNPNSSHSQRKLFVFRDAITDADIRDLAAALLEKAKAGDIRAAQLLLDKLLPDTGEAELEQRLDEIEKLLKEATR